MALLSAKQLLDELMGRDRDLGLEEKKNDFTWDGPDICKHFLVKFCPNDLFVNTKADLGVCPKIHDERMKKEYANSSRFQAMGYEDDFLRFCQSMLSDVDKRIRRARQRLALSSKEASLSQPTTLKNNEEKVNVLTEKINGLVAQVEMLGTEGKVEEAQGIMKLCDQFKEEREALRKATETAELAAAQEKQMEVCEVCGAFLIVGDAQQRVDDHLMGKQHVGYARLKEAVDEILNGREKERNDREKLRDKERDERRKVKEEEDRKREERRKRIDEDRRRDVNKSRSRRRSRDRNRSSHSRHSKDRHRRRSRSSEHKKHRSRSHDRRSRSHEHRKEKSRDRRKSHENGEPPLERNRQESVHSGD